MRDTHIERHTQRYTETGRLDKHTHTEGDTLIREGHTLRRARYTHTLRQRNLNKESETHTHTLRETHKHREKDTQ